MCVRFERPHECRGIPFPPHDEGKRPADLPGTCLGQGQASLAGVRSPPIRPVPLIAFHINWPLPANELLGNRASSGLSYKGAFPG